MPTNPFRDLFALAVAVRDDAFSRHSLKLTGDRPESPYPNYALQYEAELRSALPPP